MPNVKIGVGLGTPDAASAQIETGTAWSFRTGGGGGVLYSGSGAPSLSVGGIGDFYVDETDFPTSIDLYGPKIEGDWGSPITLGAGGVAGSFTPADLTDAGTDGITITGGTGAVNGSGTAISQHVADTTHNGYLSSTDWNTFNGKQAALSIADLTDAGTDGIVITGGTGAVIGAGTSIAQDKADATHNGYLDKDDWSAFNAKSTVAAFTDLTDTPSAYTGASGKATTVKSTEDGLEFSRVVEPDPLMVVSADSDFAMWSGFDGSHITDNGLSLDIDGTLAADSDAKIPSQKAVKAYVDANIGGTGAPDDAHYVTTQAEAGLSNEFNLGGLSDGILKQTVATGVATPAIATEGSDYLGSARIDDTAYDASSWDGDTDHAPSKNAVRDKIESLSALNKSIVGATWYNAGDPVDAGKAAGFIAFPVAGTITAWAISVDTGTATIKVWKVATGTAVPDSSNSINTSGVSISSGTHVRSTTLTDFGANTGVAANDIFAFNLESVTGSPTEVSFQLEIQK